MVSRTDRKFSHSVGAMASALIAASALWGNAAQAQTFSSQAVASTANIFGAGRTGAASTPYPGGTTDGSDPSPGGSTAPVFTLTAGTNRVLTFSSVTGTVTYDGPDGYPYYGADGGTDSNGGNPSASVAAFQGISGITFTDRHGPLIGVFINGAPAGYADGASGSDAASLTYNATALTQSQYSPLLNQSFFIGDGMTGTGTGSVQQFFVPDGATALVLGFADAPNYNGLPGSYNDNRGSLTASFAVTGAAAAPEPSASLLVAPLLPLIVGGARARRNRRKS